MAREGAGGCVRKNPHAVFQAISKIEAKKAQSQKAVADIFRSKSESGCKGSVVVCLAMLFVRALQRLP
jgi:hypothetical protein